MTIRRLALVLCALGLGVTVHKLHAQAMPEAKATTPAEMKWGAQGGLALAGMEQVNLVGDPSSPGPSPRQIGLRQFGLSPRRSRAAWPPSRR